MSRRGSRTDWCLPGNQGRQLIHVKMSAFIAQPRLSVRSFLGKPAAIWEAAEMSAIGIFEKSR